MESRGHHVAGQAREIVRELAGCGMRRCSWRPVNDNLAVSTAALVHYRDTLGDRWVRVQDGFDLAQLDTESRSFT